MATARTTATSIGEQPPRPARLDEARSTAKDLIHQIAPDADLTAIDGLASLHDLAELDSLDFLKLIALIGDTTGIVVPPRDYPEIITLDGFATYLAEHSSHDEPCRS
jgi:acyl carrier protein